RTITKRIIAHLEESSDFLVEKLVEDIARFILLDYNVQRVIIRVEKPGALRFAKSVGVEIDRDKSDYS
ncbi:MAG: dihydroneopterin aldolase, partial [Candidatus Promineifilaceae bacterium]